MSRTKRRRVRRWARCSDATAASLQRLMYGPMAVKSRSPSGRSTRCSTGHARRYYYYDIII